MEFKQEQVTTKAKKERWKPYHVGIAAEAFAAGMFAQAGCDVLIQYGANQPTYDFIVKRDKKTMAISVKGSQDGGWGLTQGHLKNGDYHAAADTWLEKHTNNIIFCLVQFQGKTIGECPDVFLASSSEIAKELKNARGGYGETVIHMERKYTRGIGIGKEYRIPENWRFSAARIEKLFSAEF